jgi:hypothetical protein
MHEDDEDQRDALATNASLFDRKDRQMLRNYASFVLGAIRRHRLLVAAVFVSVMGATVASFFVLPKTYHVETKTLAQPSSALTVRGDGPGAVSLTRVAADTILRQDNLLALIQQTNLLEYTHDHRAPAQRARDAIVKAVRGHNDSEAERLDSLVKVLGDKLVVWTSDNGTSVAGTTVTIALDWPDGPMACRLVDAAQRAFLDARYAREITALAESIDILQRHTSSLQSDIDAAVGAVETMRVARDGPTAEPVTTAPGGRPRLVSMRRPVAVHAQDDPEHKQLQEDLLANARAIEDLEAVRHHRLGDLQARLAEARMTYTENHPIIEDLRQSIAALSTESVQVARLRSEAASLRAAYAGRGDERGAATPPAVVWTAIPSGSGSTTTPPQMPSDVLRLALDLREDRDPGMVYARGQLRDAMDKYAALRTQIQTAQIDLETAQAAFKYRYTVVTPSRLPRSPTVPNVPLVTLAGLLAALLCGILCAVLTDVRRGRMVERWQLERLLERPILAEITLPDDPERA